MFPSRIAANHMMLIRVVFHVLPSSTSDYDILLNRVVSRGDRQLGTSHFGLPQVSHHNITWPNQ